MAVIDVIIISDTVCPWCYIGYRRLQKAIALFQKTYPGGSQDTFSITWKPYFLDTNPPLESVPLHDRMISHLGAEKAIKAQQYLRRVGQADGINFKFGGQIGSSRLAHQLMYFAKSKGLQNEAAEELFRAHFEEEKDITRTETVVEAGVRAGLDAEEIRPCLEGRNSEVEAEGREAQEQGIKGVPHFIIAGKDHIDGAGDVMQFFETFAEAKKTASA